MKLDMKGFPNLIEGHLVSDVDRLAASSTKAQIKFLQYVPLTMAQIEIPETLILDPEVAELIAVSLSHEEKYTDDLHLSPYFTPQEWVRHTEEIYAEYCKIFEDEDEALPTLTPARREKFVKLQNPTCACIAHKLALDKPELSWVWKLVDIPEPVTDDWGGKVVTTLLPLILEASGIMNLEVETCSQGTPHSVNFGLRLPSGDIIHLTGWPDFTVTQSFTPLAEQRISSAKRKLRLKGVGETQSPPGQTARSKMAAIAQGGIYGVGQLVYKAIKKMPVIVFFKDKSIQVFVASSTSHEESGAKTVQYEYVRNVHSVSLKDANGVQDFAQCFVAAMRYSC